jgi:hypothetical protein
VIDEAKGDEAMTLLILLAEEKTRDRLREAERYRLAASVQSKRRPRRSILQRIGLSSVGGRLKARWTWTMPIEDLEENEFGWGID